MPAYFCALTAFRCKPYKCAQFAFKKYRYRAFGTLVFRCIAPAATAVDRRWYMIYMYGKTHLDAYALRYVQ